PSLILQVIEDIGSPVSRFEKLNLHIDSIGCFLVLGSHLCQIVGFIVQSPAYPVEIDIPESRHQLTALYPYQKKSLALTSIFFNELRNHQLRISKYFHRFCSSFEEQFHSLANGFIFHQIIGAWGSHPDGKGVSRPTRRDQQNSHAAPIIASRSVKKHSPSTNK